MYYLNELQQEGMTFIPRWTPPARENNELSESGTFSSLSEFCAPHLPDCYFFISWNWFSLHQIMVDDRSRLGPLLKIIFHI